MAQGLFAGLIEGLTEAIADIRHKVVEEAWFGRQVTDVAPTLSEQSQALYGPDTTIASPISPDSERPSFAERCAAREVDDHDLTPPPADHGLDR